MSAGNLRLRIWLYRSGGAGGSGGALRLGPSWGRGHRCFGTAVSETAVHLPGPLIVEALVALCAREAAF
eukprot:CAMPEP_0180528926 /NCGR_PEP_ID=MMETSP1036_2-20121128/61070_1 /TAXON_ID=632150 /ORGANISM="Azadinium spinosum, Strain 3D9" /LENGTH=68 /DNA_ID=CAMNT_0022542541 /DNA_START=111 /DNA_END=314 /DNA_ORIENTATION=+